MAHSTASANSQTAQHNRDLHRNRNEHDLGHLSHVDERTIRTHASHRRTLLRGHQAMKESRADVLNWVHEARAEIKALPDVPARAAFLALCDYVEKRTG